MIALSFTLLTPVIGLLLMIALGKRSVAYWLNIGINFIAFIAALFLAQEIYTTGTLLAANKQFLVDSFNILFILVTTFLLTTIAIFSRHYFLHKIAAGVIHQRQLYLYHISYQVFAAVILLALVANNIGILWVAMEGATLATVLLVSLYRTKEAIEAAWKYFILCCVGIALALFGTVLFYFSAVHVVTLTHDAIFWSVLVAHAKDLDPAIIKLAFVFILVGYGTKIGLVPLHNWLPDAYAESPAPVAALLSGLLLNAALYTLIRFKIVTDLVLASHLAGNLLIGFGLLSCIFAAILLQRQKNIKRLFAYSSIEHVGIMIFALGLGSHAAVWIAILYMLLHALLKSGIFIILGNLTQLTATQNLDKIRGLLLRKPILGWALLLATLAICGSPPFGLFTCEVMVVLAALKANLWFVVILLLGLVLVLAGFLRNIQPVIYGEPTPTNASTLCLFPALMQIGLVIILGIYLPPMLQYFLEQAATLIAN